VRALVPPERPVARKTLTKDEVEIPHPQHHARLLDLQCSTACSNRLTQSQLARGQRSASAVVPRAQQHATEAG
jgi:hypothetical protein